MRQLYSELLILEYRQRGLYAAGALARDALSLMTARWMGRGSK